MRTVLLPSEDSPLVDFRILFRAGSIDDPPVKEGSSLLTATTVAQGGTREHTYPEVLEALYPMAAHVEVHAGKETTVFLATVHRDHLDPFWRLFSELLLAPRFAEADFRRNQDLQLNYLRSVLRANDDEELAKTALENLLYEGHPYGHAVHGTVKAVGSLSLEDVRAFRRNHYGAENLTVGLGGGYPRGFPEKVRETLAGLPAGRRRRAALARLRARPGIAVRIIEKSAGATAISMGFPIGVNRSHRDFVPLWFANSHLGEHRTFRGRLMRHLRGDRGLNYGDYSYVEHFEEEPGSTYPLTNVPRTAQYFSIWLRPVAHEHAHFAIRAALHELGRLVREGMSADDFDAARDFLLGYTKLWGQSGSRRLGYALDSDFYGIEEDYLGFLDRGIRSLTRRRVNAAVRRHLRPGDVKIVAVTEDGPALKDALVSDRPSPIEYPVEKPEEIVAADREIARTPLGIAADAVEVVRAVDMFES